MPMIDAFIPEDALDPQAEARLFNEITEILIRLEGFDSRNERAREATWIFLHRPKVFCAGSVPVLPRYRFILTVPEGQYNDEICRDVIREVTEAVARAERGTFAEVSQRVWVFPNEVPDGRWGGRGVVRRLPDILANIVGESERPNAERKLADRRRKTAVDVLEAVVDAARQTVGERHNVEGAFDDYHTAS